MTLPILTVVLFASFEFALLLYARSSVVDAARAGARKASYPAVNAADVETTVRNHLDARLRDSALIEVILGQHSGDRVTVAVTVPMEYAAPDLLWPIGYSLQNRTLYSVTHMTKE